MELFGNYKERIEQVRLDDFYTPYIQGVKENYEKIKDKKYTYITYKDYMEFFENGNRSRYDTRFLEMRDRLKSAAFLYFYCKEKEYLDDICDMIWVMCSFPTWCGSAHIANDWNADFSDYRGHIDLYAAELALCLGEIYYFFNNELPKEIKIIIEKELDSRIFTPFESRPYWWEPKTNNWSSVCGGSVGMTYMMVCPERFEKIKDRIISAMDYFISSYGEDGCCTEGLGYWNYGFSYYVYFADMLYRFTDGREDIRHGEKIDKMALFATNGYLDMGIGLSFADCSRGCGFNNTGFLCYLTENYQGFSVPKICFPKSPEIRNLLWSKKEIIQKTSSPKRGMYFYEKTGWYINRKDNYSFAAKAGNNAEEHNHNDVGSFIFANKTEQILVDIGQMIYDRNNFNENRYKYLHNSSLGHSVPKINGEPQCDGKEYCGSIIKAEDNEFELEIQKAYKGNLPPIIRNFKLYDNSVLLTDTFTTSPNNDIVERFVSFIKPEIRDKKVIIGNATLSSDILPEIKPVEIPALLGEMQTYFLIDYKADKEVFVLELEI